MYEDPDESRAQRERPSTPDGSVSDSTPHSTLQSSRGGPKDTVIVRTEVDLIDHEELGHDKTLTVSPIQTLGKIPSSDGRGGGGRYRDLRLIASGSTASVSEAIDQRMRRRVAIKRIHPDFVETDVADRFRREALMASWLEHPNILPVYDMVFGESGTPELVMKLIEGRTLTDAIREGGSDVTSIYQLCTMMGKVCDAVQFAHEAGVVHGDLKPQNVMVGRAGEVFVTDWGISTLRPDVSREFSERLTAMGVSLESQGSGSIRGTPAYMSPEQALGHAVDARTDVFGLGAIFYHVLCGVPLYEGSHVQKIMDCARRAEFVPPRLRRSERPIRPDLDRICRKALSIDPADRHQSAAEFAADLGRAMTNGCWFGLRRYDAGDVIVREGDASEEAFLIERGTCEVRQEAGGEVKILRTMGPGDAFGEAGIFTGNPRSATVVALEPVEVQCIDRESLMWAMSHQGPLAVLSRALAARFLDRERELS